MNEGLSLRKTAKKCDISLRTAFRWRHRFLGAMQNHQETKLHQSNVVSAFRLPFSNKGKSVLSNNNKKITSILQIDIEGKISIHVLGKYGQSPQKLISSMKESARNISSKALPSLFRSNTRKILTNNHLQETLKVQNDIHIWLKNFRGVATKYLENYWNWFTLIRQLQYRYSEQTQYMHKCF